MRIKGYAAALGLQGHLMRHGGHTHHIGQLLRLDEVHGLTRIPFAHQHHFATRDQGHQEDRM